MVTTEFDERFSPYKLHALSFHKCVSLQLSMADHATSRKGLDLILLFVSLHNARYYGNCSAGEVPSFCTHPNPIEFRPSTTSHSLCESQKVQSSNLHSCRSAKLLFL